MSSLLVPVSDAVLAKNESVASIAGGSAVRSLACCPDLQQGLPSPDFVKTRSHGEIGYPESSSDPVLGRFQSAWSHLDIADFAD